MSERYQKIYAVIFMIMLFGFAGYNIWMNWENIVTEVRDGIDKNEIITDLTENYDISSLEASAQTVNTAVNNNFVGGHLWNEVYGAFNAAMWKNEENNFAYVRDKDGLEYYANFWNQPNITMKELAKRMKRMKDDLEPQGTKVILLLYPTRYDSEWADGYYGIPYQDYNEYADEYLRYLRRYDVDYIDYREIFENTGKRGDELFYKTDHHWHSQAAFYAMTKLVDYIRYEYGDDLDPTGKYCDMNNYYQDTYKESFMGSMGRETGELYGGLDDFTLMTPKFETSVRYSYYTSSGQTLGNEGSFTDTLILKRQFTRDDLYLRDLNNCYMSGVMLADEIENNLAENDTSVLMIRNSYSSPVAVFLTPMIKKMDLVWGINASERSIMERIENNHYDYVIVAINVDNFDNEENFTFYTEATEELGSEDEDSEVEDE